MFDYLPKETAITAIFLALLSIGFCLTQIFLRKKLNFIALCKVTVYVPFLSIVITILNSNARALVDISTANDMSRPIIMRGDAAMLASLSFGIFLTIVLAALYAITMAVYKNQKLKVQK